jgi:hypothetical protein
MDIEFFEVVDFDAAVELGESVERAFRRPPIETVLPVCGQAFDVR